MDSSLKKLNLGLTVWVELRGDSRSDGSFWSEDLGYAKIDGKWGIALRTVDGTHYDPEGADVEAWLFNDAPRTLRLTAIGKIPELLEKLSQEAVETTKRIKNKLAEAQEVAAAVKQLAEKPKTERVTLKPVEGKKQ